MRTNLHPNPTSMQKIILSLAFLILLPFAVFSQIDQATTSTTTDTKTEKEKVKEKEKEKPKKNNKYNGQPYYHPDLRTDEDRDGVANGNDKCPHTPRGIKVDTFGCPLDSDGDGLYDYMDNCPQEYGPLANSGCPWGDKDKDGITDDQDKCPDTPGVLRFQGCPDRDGDGIPDSEDQCPTVPGVREYRGCPPIKKDTDKDGIFDDVDVCPTVPGIPENHGCPPVIAVKETIDEVVKNLNFDFALATIRPTSYPSLDKLAVVLRQHPEYKLVVEGHTDNVGDDESNLKLSRDRADAVRTYLIQWGITPERISTNGFGETKPVATNATEDGRQLNRRVDFTVKPN